MRYFLLVSLFLFSSLSAEKKETASKMSEAFGHLIGKNIETIGVDFDLELVLKGLRDATEGKDSPMTEQECIEALSAAQAASFQEKAVVNLEKAEKFLKENAKAKNVVVVDEGKLQYKVEKKGKGNPVKEGSSPKILYTGKYLDGTVFDSSKEEISIPLEQTIQGFQKGLVGMKEGEKRTLYIHPEYGYGTQGNLPPNSLLTFEIELIKADSSEDQLILESEEAGSSKELDAPALR